MNYTVLIIILGKMNEQETIAQVLVTPLEMTFAQTVGHYDRAIDTYGM